jgi:Mn-dependent DtxR family transcriptional regulator
MLNSTERLVLVALFRLARHNRHATAIRLATALGVDVPAVRDALAALDQRGLVDGERVRLSLNGLVVATSLSASVVVREKRTRRTLRRAA